MTKTEEKLSKMIKTAINLSEIKDKAKDILSEIKSSGIFTEYTKHDISHSEKMIKICEQLFKDSIAELNDAELFLLTVSAYFHDIGMAVNKNEKKNIINGSIIEDRFSQIQSFSKYKQKNSGDDDIIFESYIRKYHHIRGENFIKEKGLEIGIPKFLVNIVGDIVRSHCEKKLEQFETSIQVDFNGKKFNINPQFIAILIRLSDILDMCDSRAPKFLQQFIEVDNKMSLSEWERHLSINNVYLREENKKIIDILGETENPDVFFALEKYRNWIYDEIRYCKKIIETYNDTLSKKYKLLIENVLTEKFKTIGFEKENFDITVDTKSIINLLIGKSFYIDHNRTVIRELLLNSIDACRSYKSLNNTFKPEITISLNNKDKTLTINDNGIGMNDYIIKNFLLKAGSAYYSNNDMFDFGNDFQAYSKFGIGFFSSFLIANKIIVETKFFKGNDVIKLRISDLSKKVLYEIINNETASQGTKITLHLNNEINKIEDHICYWIRHLEFEIQLFVDNSMVEISNNSFEEKIIIKDSILDQEINLEEKVISFSDANIEGNGKLILDNNQFVNLRFVNPNIKILNFKKSISQRGIFFTSERPLPDYWGDFGLSFDIDIKNGFNLNPELSRMQIIKDDIWLNFTKKIEDKILDWLIDYFLKKSKKELSLNANYYMNKFFNIGNLRNTLFENKDLCKFIDLFPFINYRSSSKIECIRLSEFIKKKRIKIVPYSLTITMGHFDDKKYREALKLYKKFTDDNSKDTYYCTSFNDLSNIFYSNFFIEKININENNVIETIFNKKGKQTLSPKNTALNESKYIPFEKNNSPISDILMTEFYGTQLFNIYHPIIAWLQNQDDTIMQKFISLFSNLKLPAVYFSTSKKLIMDVNNRLQELLKHLKLSEEFTLSEDDFSNSDIMEFWFDQLK